MDGISGTLIVVHIRGVVTISMGHNTSKDTIFKILGKKLFVDMLFQHCSFLTLSTKEF